MTEEIKRDTTSLNAKDSVNDDLEPFLKGLWEESKEEVNKQTSVINTYQELGIKYTFLLNGAAAVAVTTMFTTVFIERPELAKFVLSSINVFAWGAFLSAFSVITAFYSNIFCRNSHKSMSKFFMELKTLLDKEKNKKFLSNTNTILKKHHRADNIHIVLSIVTNLLILISLFCFIIGINKASTPFYEDITKEPTAQVTSTNSSYPNVEITPILNKH